MNKKTNEELQDLVMKATSGDKETLEMLVTGVQDIIFNLSLRMLGTFADAEDATQDILLKMITHLFFSRGQFLYNMGIQHCGQSPEKLQKAYVRPLSVEL